MHFEWTDWNGLTRDQFHQIALLRQAIFVVEQDCAYADLDGLDPQAMHLLLSEGPALVAYLRAFRAGALRAESVIGRVVVADTHRRQGLASQLMERAHAELEGPIFLSAQAHLRGFYGSLGYQVSGPGYDEDGIPHLPMIRPL